MKKSTKIILGLLFVAAFSACKKEYHCDATLAGVTYDLHCEKCSKSEVEDYKKSLEAGGYTDVSCDKK